jgi:hypothetical protein
MEQVIDHKGNKSHNQHTRELNEEFITESVAIQIGLLTLHGCASLPT